MSQDVNKNLLDIASNFLVVFTQINELLKTKNIAGPGLKYYNNKLGVVPGPGIAIDDKNEVTVKLSEDLQFVDGKIVINKVVKEDKSLHFSTLTNSDLVLVGHKLTLKKTFTDYKITKNDTGLILDFVNLGDRHEDVYVDLPNPGYNSIVSIPNRENTQKAPNFYKSK
jgi:hypothetical protein